MPHVNYLAVLVSGVAIFMLGGLWYSPALFANPWIRLMGKSKEDLKAGAAGALPFVLAFLCGIAVALGMAIVLNHFQPLTIVRAIEVAVVLWAAFAAATSFATATFSGSPRALWMINSGYNLVSFIIAAVIETVWR